MSVRDYTIKNFTHGIVDEIEEISIPSGAASASKNWLTRGDRIELRPGYAVKGTRVAGTDRVTGIHVTYRADGTQVLLRKYLRKLLYFDEGAATPDWVEIGSDFFPAAASSDEVLFANYFSTAGAQCWFSSPNSGYYKMMVNGGRSDVVAPAAKDNYDSSLNFKGYIRISLNRAFLWGRSADKTGLYLSYIDERNTTAVSAEALGAAGSLTYSGTLAAVTGKRTCYGVSITDGVETFTDDFSGTLTGSAGGTGTINYSSGAYSVTFAALAAGSVTASYNWEDATNNGIADFGFSATRLAGQGAIFRQDDGGSPILHVGTYKNIEYCFHKLKTWLLTLGQDDTTATNDLYRERVGIPSIRAAVPTGAGIFYIDYTDESEPRIRLLTFDAGSSEVIPVPVSNNINLSDYRFDMAWGIEYDDFILWGCRHKDYTYNQTVLAYNKLWKSWDVLDYFTTCAAIYNGALIAGDSLSPNALELFSGWDDDGNTIDNYWITGLDDQKVEELKKTKELWLRGLIMPDQSYDVYASVDNDGFVNIGTISGSGAYVDVGQAVSIGALLIGGNAIGGGGSGDNAYNYYAKLNFRSQVDRYERVKLKFVATGIGYVSISIVNFHDITRHGNRIPNKYNP